ncbi:MAG: hypothetical protein II584_00990 [Treponema sp.]|nr:hypothetical protein [Treponema sp.]MBQ2600954.1 hypothetical protein [Treponema sp.]
MEELVGAEQNTELAKVESAAKTIKIRGKEREVKFGFSAWAELEKKYDGIKNFDRVEKEMRQYPFRTLPELVYIGLVDKEGASKDGITKENCLDDYGMADIQTITEVLESALYGSLPKEDSDTAKKK